MPPTGLSPLSVAPRRSGERAFRLGAVLLGWALLRLCQPTAAAPQAPASIRGTLLDRVARTPIEGARVAVVGFARAANTDSAGRFEILGVQPGVRVVQARAMGYATAMWIVELQDGQLFEQPFELEPRAVEVAGIDVTAKQDEGNAWRTESGFEQRRRSGRGFFITRQDIQGRRANTVSDLLRTVPGVMTTCGSRGCVVQMIRSTSLCRPEFFLDGYPATLATGPDFPINVTAIRGVEVYRDQFEAPAELQKPGLRCGVIAIWTIEPGERLDRRP
jgi:hypothetical protein